MTYTKEDYKIDIEWLRSEGIQTEEVDEFVLSLITEGFKMTKKEFVKFMKTVEVEE